MADQNERKEFATALAKHVWGMARNYGDREQGSFLIDAGLGMLGLSSADEQTVQAAVQPAASLIDDVKANMATIQQFYVAYQKMQPLFAKWYPQAEALMPAVKIMADALANSDKSDFSFGDQNGGGQGRTPPEA